MKIYFATLAAIFIANFFISFVINAFSWLIFSTEIILVAVIILLIQDKSEKDYLMFKRLLEIGRLAQIAISASYCEFLVKTILKIINTEKPSGKNKRFAMGIYRILNSKINSINESKLWRIDCAAIKLPDGSLIKAPPPKRHHHIIQIIRDRGYKKAGVLGAEQGFIAVKGNESKFVDRIEGAKIAIAANQVKLNPNNKSGLSEGLNWPPNLYSEDLW